MISINNSEVNPTIFPDNTSQIWKISELLLQTNPLITWEFTHEGEFMQLAQLKHLFDSRGRECDLVLKYLPYGRQDKDVSNDTTFALHTFAKLLNALEFRAITIIDPHSDVALKVINRSYAVYPADELHRVIKLTKAEMVCYPDKGAQNKYTKIYNYDFIYGKKVRDQATGNITNYEVVGFCKGRRVLIVDDICDGGATFRLLARDLLTAGAKEVNLFVTHGIFSKGLKPLKEAGISRIFTKDGEIGEFQDNITIRRML